MHESGSSQTLNEATEASSYVARDDKCLRSYRNRSSVENDRTLPSSTERNISECIGLSNCADQLLDSPTARIRPTRVSSALSPQASQSILYNLPFRTMSIHTSQKPEVFRIMSNRTYRSSFAEHSLESPLRPNIQSDITSESSFSPSTSKLQIDGGFDSADSDNSEATVCTSRVTRHETLCYIRSNDSNRVSADLTLPEQDVFPVPVERDDPCTPLTRATPAKNAFPLPPLSDAGVLSPLKGRLPASPLRPSQRVSLTPSSSSTQSPKTPSHTPDRFMPARHSGSIKDRFRFCKSPEVLSDQERITRSTHSGPDPFARHIRTNSTRVVARTRSQTHSAPATPTSFGAHSVLSVRRNSAGVAGRNFSIGAIWNVGGSHSAGSEPTSVSNSRGGFITGGNNAPLYSATFFAQSDPASEQDMHERRLALAFDFDTSSRLISNDRSSSARPISAMDGMKNERAKHVWKNNEWSRSASGIRRDSLSSRLTKADYPSGSRRATKLKKPIPMIPFR